MKKIGSILLIWLGLMSSALAATTLDPADINDIVGTGTLSGGNLTLSSTGASYAQSTTAATAKQTFQSTLSANTAAIISPVVISSSSAGTDGFSLFYDGSHWVLQDTSATTFATGTASPSPAAGQIYTLDCDPVGNTISVRVNGTAVFTNQSVSGHAPTSWFAVVAAGDASIFGTTFNSTVAFSGLTYAPLSGYSEWDSGGPPPVVSRLRSLTGVGR